MALDALLVLLGRGCPWIIGWYIFLNLLRATSSNFNFSSFLWANAKPRSVRCKIPEGFLLNMSVPFETKNGVSQPSRCLQYFNFTNTFNKTVPCQNGYEYVSYVDTSVTTDWDLVCDKEYLSALADSSFFMSSIVGTLISNALADRFGRKPIFLGCMIAQAVMGFVAGLSPNIYVYIVVRFVLGPLQQGMYTIGFCYVLELFPLQWRTSAALLSELFWSISGVIQVAVVYFAREWRLYHYVTTLPYLVFVGLFFVMPESVPWLIAKGRIQEAKNTLRKAARFSKYRDQFLQKLQSTTFLSSGKEEPMEMSECNEMSTEKPVLTDNTTNHDDDVAIYPCYYAFTRKYVRLSTFINIFVWFTVGCSHYGLQVKAMQVGNCYLNFLLLTLIDVPAIVGAVPLSRKLGRKAMLMIGYFILGPCFILLYVTMTYLPDVIALHITISLIGKLMVTLIFTVVFLHTSELYPTSLRSVGMAIGTSCARTGITVTPFLVMLDHVWSWFPTAFLSTFAIISGILVNFLSETKNKPLPRTLDDINQWHEKKERKRGSLLSERT